MKSFKLVLICLICSIDAYAQNTIVRYAEYRKVEDQENVSFLITDGVSSFNISAYKELYIKFEDLLNDKDFTENEPITRNIKKDSILSNIYFGVSPLPIKGTAIYKDEFPAIQWKMEAGKETILGYQCNLATAKFRGRKYKVWYTTEIPLAIGPWKLGGLPGLILKADADDGLFTFKATSIIFNSPLQVPKRFVEMYTKHQDKIIPYDRFIKTENKMTRELVQQSISDMKVGTNFTPNTKHRINLIELEF